MKNLFTSLFFLSFIMSLTMPIVTTPSKLTFFNKRPPIDDGGGEGDYGRS